MAVYGSSCRWNDGEALAGSSSLALHDGLNWEWHRRVDLAGHS